MIAISFDMHRKTIYRHLFNSFKLSTRYPSWQVLCVKMFISTLYLTADLNQSPSIKKTKITYLSTSATWTQKRSNTTEAVYNKNISVCNFMITKEKKRKEKKNINFMPSLLSTVWFLNIGNLASKNHIF